MNKYEYKILNKSPLVEELISIENSNRSLFEGNSILFKNYIEKLKKAYSRNDIKLDENFKAMFANGFKESLYDFTEEYNPATKASFIKAFSETNNVDKRTAKVIYEQRINRGDVDYINFIIESYRGNLIQEDMPSTTMHLCPRCVKQLQSSDYDEDVFVGKRMYWDDYADTTDEFTCDWCGLPKETLYNVSFR